VEKVLPIDTPAPLSVCQSCPKVIFATVYVALALHFDEELSPNFTLTPCGDDLP